MMKNPFNFPSVDHLVEGRDYRVVEWSFADGAPVEQQPPAQQPAQQQQQQQQLPPQQGQAPQSPCAPDEKMVFGVCRKAGGKNPQDETDFDSGKKSEQEKAAEAEAKKQGSDQKNNKPVMVNGKKMGWAVKNGKPVMVEWNSVAGAKQPAAAPTPPPTKGASGGPQPLKAKANPPAQQPAAPTPAPAQQSQQPANNSAKVAELQEALKTPNLPPAAQKALQGIIDLLGT